jgi:ribokinase
MPRYITIGNITLDDVVLPDGTFIQGAFGGGSIYSAAGARIWSQTKGGIGIVSKVGSDYPEANLESLRSFGIDTKGIFESNQPNIRVWMLYEGGSKRQILFHLDSGRSPEMDPQAKDFISEYEDVDFAHIAPMAVSSQVGFSKLLTEKAIPYSWDLGLVGPEVNPKDMIRLGGLMECKVFLPSEQEVNAIWEDDVSLSLLRKISKAGPQIVAIKLGDRGSLVYDRLADRGFHVPILPVDVIDTTGAGDAYCGGFMVGYHKTGDALEAAMFGTVSASYAIQHHSAWQMLNADFGDSHERLDWLRGMGIPL